MTTRLAFGSGLLFLVIATVYYLLSRDAGGATMLLCLAIGMSVMWYVLLSGSSSSES